MRRLITFLIITLSVFNTNSCKDKPTEPGRGGGSTTISLNSPADGEQAVQLSVELRWYISRALNDSLTVDLYFGQNAEPELFQRFWRFSEGRAFVRFLQPNVTYYWQVTISDADSVIATSPTWEFHTVGSHSPIFSYPITIGNEWEYEQISYWKNVSPAEIRRDFVDTTEKTSHLSVVGVDTVEIDSVLHAVFMLEESIAFGGVTACKDTVLLRQSSDSVQHVPTCDWRPVPCGSVGSPRISGESLPTDISLFNPSILTNPNAGDLYSASYCDGLLSYHVATPLIYPLTVGSAWDYGVLRGVPLSPYTKRMVVGYQDVDTPAGEFTCAVVAWNYNSYYEGSDRLFIFGFDYVADIGIVKRTFTVWNYPVSSFPDYIGIAKGDQHYETYLISYSIVE